MDQPVTKAIFSILKFLVNNSCWHLILSHKVIVGNFDPLCFLSALLGDVESPFPNKFIDIIKCFSGLIALFAPKKPSFLLCVPV